MRNGGWIAGFLLHMAIGHVVSKSVLVFVTHLNSGQSEMDSRALPTQENQLTGSKKSKSDRIDWTDIANLIFHSV